MQLRVLFALFAFTVGLHPTANADNKASPLLWDLDRLSKAPKAEWGKKQDLVQEVYYVGEPFRGKPTRVFAYVGRPAKGDGPFPGMV
ncbi:MAG: hypothetical protein IH991_03505, partial [Planctomycetes bacterium]|nr:hypothetical protein [Planctomycetota bacterium]